MGLVNLMAWVDAGSHLQPNYQGPEVKNLREWAEIVRRLQLPYYEEARLHMHKARNAGMLKGANETTSFQPQFCKRVVNCYAGK